MFKADVEGEKATSCDGLEKGRGAEDVVDLRLASVVSRRDRGVGVFIFVDVEKVVGCEELFPRVVSFSGVRSGVGVDEEYVVLVVLAKGREEFREVREELLTGISGVGVGDGHDALLLSI